MGPVASKAAKRSGRFDTIADIGGGRGHLLRAVLDAVPTAEGILFDLPDVIQALDVGRERLTARAVDVIMLAVTGGRERTGSQLGGLLEGAGFSDTRVIDTGGPMRIVEPVAR